MSETALEHFLEALFWEGELLLRREPEEVSLATLSQEEELLRDELLRLLQGRTPPQQANPSSDAESSSSSSSSSSSPSSPLTTTTEEEVCRVREDECVVCLNEMANTVILTECWHPFHYDCLVNWLRQQYKCPTCRRELDLRKVELYWVEGEDQWETLPSQGLEVVHAELVGLHAGRKKS